jgi:hypothetical protein
MNIFRRNASRQRVERLIREGVGLNEASWTLPGGEVTDGLHEGIVAWVRESMAVMRRPHGIDQVAVAFACRDGDGQVVCSNSLGVVRPGAFYGPEGEDRIAAFLDDLGAVPTAQRREVVGALLSLGDLAYELNLPKAA